jgi:hypothetical protein
MVVFMEPIVTDYTILLVCVIPNLLLADLVDCKLHDLSYLGANGTTSSLTERDAREPKSFPGIYHQLEQSDKDGHYHWDCPSEVKFSVQAYHEPETIIPGNFKTHKINEIDGEGATFGKGDASVAPEAFCDLNSSQQVEMVATFVPNGPYVQYYSPYMNEGLTGISIGEKKISRGDCTNGHLAVIIGRETKIVSRFMTRAPNESSFAEVTSETSSD